MTEWTRSTRTAELHSSPKMRSLRSLGKAPGPATAAQSLNLPILRRAMNEPVRIRVPVHAAISVKSIEEVT